MRRCSCFLSVLMMLAVGCDSPTKVQPSITGQVALYDEWGHLLPTAAQVQVNALSLSSIRKYETFTDASGRFELELPNGEAVPLLFSRDGFGDMFRFDLEQETEPIQVSLFARSSAAVTAADAVAESCGTVNCLRLALDVENFFVPGATRRVFRLYLSTDPGVSFFEYQLTDLLFVPDTQPGLVKAGSHATFELDGLHGLLGSFTTGTTVYLVIHGATENLASSYTGPDSGLEISALVSVEEQLHRAGTPQERHDFEVAVEEHPAFFELRREGQGLLAEQCGLLPALFEQQLDLANLGIRQFQLRIEPLALFRHALGFGGQRPQLALELVDPHPQLVELVVCRRGRGRHSGTRKHHTQESGQNTGESPHDPHCTARTASTCCRITGALISSDILEYKRGVPWMVSIPSISTCSVSAIPP